MGIEYHFDLEYLLMELQYHRLMEEIIKQAVYLQGAYDRDRMFCFVSRA